MMNEQYKSIFDYDVCVYCRDKGYYYDSFFGEECFCTCQAGLILKQICKCGENHTCAEDLKCYLLFV